MPSESIFRYRNSVWTHPAHEQPETEREPLPARADTGRHHVPQTARGVALDGPVGDDHREEDERGHDSEEGGEGEDPEREERGRDEAVSARAHPL